MGRQSAEAREHRKTDEPKKCLETKTVYKEHLPCLDPPTPLCPPRNSQDQDVGEAHSPAWTGQSDKSMVKVASISAVVPNMMAEP